MLHPDTELRTINPRIGCGIFATADIPRGTIVYAKDAMEIIVFEEDMLYRDKKYREHIKKYSYTEADGSKVLSWDLAKYVNHACDSNTLSTGYGFEIAVRDIVKGEQITDDYGMLNIECMMSCECGSLFCRKNIGVNDFATSVDNWDRRVQAAIDCLPDVAQPLLGYLNGETRSLLEGYLVGSHDYRSVSELERRISQNIA
ncbi:SET domain-containing protein [Sulfuriflexus sp.]|uniref:SET domain-containing protein n=1 Tax=Sulfuriflexus sp. TaxID=2015443 RepID=UPI0028CF6A0E|nr:SET domain-containing protein [Sulfuriflexus sp.]MDT8405287.1 SET domain-containing protein [Sulfuriflexus sp.]